MDLKAANLADERTWRWTRAGMVACFIVASVMLIASLAMANGSKAAFHPLTMLPAPLTH